MLIFRFCEDRKSAICKAQGTFKRLITCIDDLLQSSFPLLDEKHDSFDFAYSESIPTCRFSKPRENLNYCL